TQIATSANGMARPRSCPVRRSVLQGFNSTRSTSPVQQIPALRTRDDRRRCRRGRPAVLAGEPCRERKLIVGIVDRDLLDTCQRSLLEGMAFSPSCPGSNAWFNCRQRMKDYAMEYH